MPFTIPNIADAEDQTQAQVDARDFRDILVPAFNYTGVLSGCAVTAQGTPDMTVAVATGTVVVNGAVAAVAGGNVTIGANATGNARFDLICVDSTGAKSAVAGVASAAPVFSDPAGKVVLAAVRVPAGATSISSAKIVDKRMPLADSGSGKELDYVERTQTLPINALSDGTADVILTSNSIPYDGVSAVMIEFFSPYIELSGAPNSQNFLPNWFLDGVDQGRMFNLAFAGSIGSNYIAQPCFGFRRVVIPPGFHVISIRAWKTSSALAANVGAGVGGAGNYSPAYMRIVKAT